jgi:predicted small lipoprotein YifL
MRRATKIHQGLWQHGPRRWIAALLVIVVSFSGCGPRGPQRFQLEGKVTFDGKTVPSGTIRFEPDSTKGNTGPVGYTAIKDGRYTTAMEGSKGSLKGPIVAFLTGGPAPDPKVEFPKMWFIDHRTTLTLEPKSGATTFDFDVPKDTPRPK